MIADYINRIKSRLLFGWTVMRLLRVALGVVAGIEAVYNADLMLGALAGILLYQGLFNAGCCGMGSCEINHVSGKQTSAITAPSDTTFTEVK